MDERLLYVYCATGHSLDLKQLAEAETVFSLPFGELFAVCRKVTHDDFSEENLKKNFGDLTWVEKQTREHIRVIGLVMEQGTTVPFKFGTVFKTVESLGLFFETYSDELHKNLQSLSGKQEWAVKLFCDKEMFHHHIKDMSDDIKSLEAEMHDSKPGRAFIIKRKLAELMKDENHRQLSNYGQLFFEQISKLCSQTMINPLLPKEVTERPDEMVLNLACLVDQSNAAVLVQKVEALSKEYHKAGLLPEVSGPWPAFSFVKID